MTRVLAAASDFVQFNQEGPGKKGAFALLASGLYAPVSVLADDAGNTIDSAAASLAAAGTERGIVTRAAGVTQVQQTGAAALADATANPTVPMVAAAMEAYDGATWDRARSIDAYKAASATPDVGIQAVGQAERRYTAVTLALAAGSTQTWDTEAAAEAIVSVGTTTTGTILFEVSPDGTSWITAEAWDTANQRALNGATVTPTAGIGYRIDVAAHRTLRVRVVTALAATIGLTTTLSPFVRMPMRIDTGQGRALLGVSLNLAANGVATIAAAAGLKAKVFAIMFTATAATTLTIAGAMVATGAMSFAANGGFVMATMPSAHFMESSAVNTAMTFTVGAGGAGTGFVSYFLEP